MKKRNILLLKQEKRDKLGVVILDFNIELQMRRWSIKTWKKEKSV